MSFPDRDLTLLAPAFLPRALELLEAVNARGTSRFAVRPFFAARSPWAQARLWWQSRPWLEIDRAIRALEAAGAPSLANVLRDVGPQTGRWATNALPGSSWHQWCEALDCFVVDLVTGRATWDAGHPGYAAYAEEAERRGLTAGLRWRVADAVHVQLRAAPAPPLETWAIAESMLDRFGTTEAGAEAALRAHLAARPT